MLLAVHPKRAGLGDLHHLIECRDCGLFQRLHKVEAGDVAACGRCHATLRKTQNNSASLVCTVAASVLYVFAVSFPLMTLRAAGRVSEGTIFTGPEMLDQWGMPEVGDLVLLTLVAAPAVKLFILLSAFWGERSLHPPPRWVAWLFGWLERIGPWAMVEVFLLGVFVAYTRLRAIADVEIDGALLALGGLMLTMVAADASLDHHALWEALGRHGFHHHALGRTHGKLIGCHVCGLVSRSPEKSPCPRCQHPLHRRKPNSIVRSAAFMFAALALYLPANAFPIMTVTRLGQGGAHTLLSGVVELFEAQLWPLAIIVLLASVVIPMLKLGGIAVMLWATHRKSTRGLMLRTRICRIINVIGRWSMIDIFALTTLVALVRLGFLATVLPGDGAIAFSGVVILTMLSTECFDPRLMWDAARGSGPRAIPVAIHSTELAT